MSSGLSWPCATQTFLSPYRYEPFIVLANSVWFGQTVVSHLCAQPGPRCRGQNSRAERANVGQRRDTVLELIVYVIIGIVAGWLAGVIMKGQGFGLVINLIVGLIGAFVGGFVFTFLGLSVHGLIGSVIMATVGAVVLLLVIGFLKQL